MLQTPAQTPGGALSRKFEFLYLINIELFSRLPEVVAILHGKPAFW
jgi:hypothetical protein